MRPPLVPPVHVLAACVAALVVATAALALVAQTIHVRRARAEQRRAERWARWEPLLIEAVVPPGPSASPRAFFAEVRPGEEDDALALLTQFALRLAGRDLARLADAAAPLLRRARARLHARRADRRASAARLLGLLGTEADHARLADLLADPSTAVAMTAARALARTHNPMHVPALLDALDRFTAWGTPTVASMLVRYGLPAGPALAAALADEGRTEATRLAAAEALRRLGYSPSAEAAAALLAAPTVRVAGAPSREIVAAALRLVRDVGGPPHADAVRPLIDSPDEVVRLHAVSALAAVSRRPDDAARLEYVVGDASVWVALRAARGLVESGRVASLHALAAGDDLRGERARLALAQAGLLHGLPQGAPAASEMRPEDDADALVLLRAARLPQTA